jgi:16S rRNA (cytosine1402-N4)-methyltransferase
VTQGFHTPVLYEEVLHFLITNINGTYVDGTLGGGGHAEGICRRLTSEACFIGFDADEDALRVAAERLKDVPPRVILVHANVRTMKSELMHRGIVTISGLFLDLGVSSYQLDEQMKGFSFRSDERIDMRMDRRQSLSGWHVVNEYDEQRLAAIISEYGEERNARRIARAIVHARPVDTTQQLARVVEKAAGKRFLVKTLARVFQAIRIEVNDELRSLEHALADGIDMLEGGGRLVVISYHSLEDRIVKTMFRNASMTTQRSGHKYLPDTPLRPRLRLLTKSPVTASAAEIARNPRARSAKLRVAERIAHEVDKE